MNKPKFLTTGYWNVGVIESPIEDIMKSESVNIRWMKHKYKDRFFADPFLFKTDPDYYYIFAEEWEFVKKKGIIVLLKINRSTMKLEDKHTVIDDDFHLSYPFPEDGCIIAENYKSGALHKFIIDSNTLTAVRKEKILDVPLIDPTFIEYNGKKIINYEMESSALAGLAHLLGHKATTVCMVIANRIEKNADTSYKTHIDDLIQLVLERI